MSLKFRRNFMKEGWKLVNLMFCIAFPQYHKLPYITPFRNNFSLLRFCCKPLASWSCFASVLVKSSCLLPRAFSSYLSAYWIMTLWRTHRQLNPCEHLTKQSKKTKKHCIIKLCLFESRCIVKSFKSTRQPRATINKLRGPACEN